MPVPVYIDNVAPGQGLPPAELIRAACRSPIGMAIMDRYLDSGGSGRPLERIRQSARDLCASCPVLVECRNWVERAERPAGSWHGMYAGATASERKYRAKRAEAEAELIADAASAS